MVTGKHLLDIDFICLWINKIQELGRHGYFICINFGAFLVKMINFIREVSTLPSQYFTLSL